MRLKAGLDLFNNTLREKGPRSLANLCLSYITLKLEPEKVWTKPIYLQIEPTTKCNLKCKMCYGAYKRRICDDLNLEGFQRIINQIPPLIKVHMQGIGEPFLNKDIFKMIRYAKSKGIEVDLTTNATLLNSNTAKEIISSGLDYIELSIDSPIPQTYEKIRSGADFEKVISNVKNLVKEKDKLKKPEMKITTVVMDENVEEIPQMAELTHKLGINSLYLVHIQPWGSDYFKKRCQDDIGFEQKKEKAIQEMKRIAKNSGIYLDLFTTKKGEMVRACKRPWLSISVLADGYVVPCCRVITPAEINFGNLLKDDFKDIWNSPKYRAFRKTLKSNASPTACNNCYYYYRNPMSRDHI